MKQLRFDGRSALITGSSQGLGFEYARLLASRGAKVVLNGRDHDTLERAAALIREDGGLVTIAKGDLSTEQGCKDVAARVLDDNGVLDVLINNAGVSRRVAFKDITVADYREMLALNLDSTFLMIREVWPQMKARGYGRIVNTGSGAGTFGTRNHALYGMAKAAVHGLTRVLALDGDEAGISVNTITPLAATRLANNIQDPSLRESFLAALPAERCAPLVCWLAHESCTANGEMFDVGGGGAARIFTALAPGYFNPDALPEDIAANARALFDESGYIVPRDGERRAANLIARVKDWTGAH
jgi:NAD(P)-dependent dehydrogenase (short-subunit alcohol dehydrogenase family)